MSMIKQFVKLVIERFKITDGGDRSEPFDGLTVADFGELTLELEQLKCFKFKDKYYRIRCVTFNHTPPVSGRLDVVECQPGPECEPEPETVTVTETQPDPPAEPDGT